MNQRTLPRTSGLIADAAIRVIARNGFDQVSVRHVAAEAALAPGTVQHHFSSRDALLTGAMKRVIERQLQRVVATGLTDHPSATLRRAMIEVMPFDETRREEAIVWLVFSAAAPSHASLRIPHTAGIDMMRDLLRNLLASARERGFLRAGLDLDAETVLLAATIDGLMMHAINTESDGQPLIEAALDLAIRRLFIEVDQPTNHVPLPRTRR